jgi:hypothetical protein
MHVTKDSCTARVNDDANPFGIVNIWSEIPLAGSGNTAKYWIARPYSPAAGGQGHDD